MYAKNNNFDYSAAGRSKVINSTKGLKPKVLSSLKRLRQDWKPSGYNFKSISDEQ